MPAILSTPHFKWSVFIICGQTGRLLVLFKQQIMQLHSSIDRTPRKAL